MASWDSFKSTLGAVGKKLTGGGSYLSEDEQRKEEAFTANIRNALDDVNKKIESLPGPNVGKAVTKFSADLLLKGLVHSHAPLVIINTSIVGDKPFRTVQARTAQV